jgi:hypothetical protein
VAVVSALVRATVVHGSVGQIRGLGHRQAIEIGTQRDRLAVAAGLQIRDDAGDRRGACLVAVTREELADERARAVLLEAELGMLVDVAADRRELGVERGDLGLQGSIEQRHGRAS